MASGPITSWQIDGQRMETVTDFTFGGAPKSLQMVAAAMKLKDTCSLEKKDRILKSTCIHITHEGPFSGISKFSFVFNTQLLSRLVKLDVY